MRSRPTRRGLYLPALAVLKRRGGPAMFKARLVSPAQASLPRSWPTPELRLPNAAAQTRIVSKARIRLHSRKSVRSFKGIICVDISEIAVGTLITERPPHRTERARFGHSAPTSGV